MDNVNVQLCGKCKKFFHDCMRYRLHLTLRCIGKRPGPCVNILGKVDLNCGKCRLDVCKSIGLVKAYHETSEQVHTSLMRIMTDLLNDSCFQFFSGAEDCLVCEELCGEDVTYVFGVKICNGCKYFLLKALEHKRFLNLKCDYNRSCLIEKGRTDCESCWFDKIKTTGLLHW